MDIQYEREIEILQPACCVSDESWRLMCAWAGCYFYDRCRYFTLDTLVKYAATVGDPDKKISIVCLRRTTVAITWVRVVEARKHCSMPSCGSS